MSVQERLIQKFINNALYHGYIRLAAESRLDDGSGIDELKDRAGNVVEAERLKTIEHMPDSNTDLTVANRVVHLEGYETHEDVVRAYLEFSGIDPDSKEGQFYFEL